MNTSVTMGVARAQAFCDHPIQFLEFEVRGVRKVTTGITGLWQPSVHSDVAF